MKKIVIGKIKIEKTEMGFKLSSIVVRNNEETELFFDYDVDSKEYLDDEFADPFLVSILPYAMEHGYDIYCENPISSSTYYSIVNDFVPSLSKYQSKVFNSIEVFGEIIERREKNNKGVATGVSCGVDSFHTILKTYKESKVPEKYKLTHLVILNSGACSWKGGEESKKWFDIEANRGKKVADAIGVGLIRGNTNLMEFYQEDHEKSGFSRIIGCIMGIDNLIGKYYLASSYTLGNQNFDLFGGPSYDDGYYAFFTANSFSNLNTKFLICGNSENRDDKVKFIADSSVAQNYLTVCWFGGDNCGVCEKCLRTIGALYSIDKLDNFNKVFDVEDFYSHKTKRIAYMMKYRNEHKKMYYGFLTSIRKEKKSQYFKSRLFYLLLVYPIYIIKKIAKKILPKSIVNKIRKRKER